ncbi:MAG: hypothetical protein R8M45_08635 [Ghiorsea sp.]
MVEIKTTNMQQQASWQEHYTTLPRIGDWIESGNDGNRVTYEVRHIVHHTPSSQVEILVQEIDFHKSLR